MNRADFERVVDLTLEELPPPSPPTSTISQSSLKPTRHANRRNTVVRCLASTRVSHSLIEGLATSELYPIESQSSWMRTWRWVWGKQPPSERCARPCCTRSDIT